MTAIADPADVVRDMSVGPNHLLILVQRHPGCCRCKSSTSDRLKASGKIAQGSTVNIADSMQEGDDQPWSKMLYKFEAVHNYDAAHTQLFMNGGLLLATIPWHTYRTTALFIHPANIVMLKLPVDSYIAPTASDQTPILTADELVKVISIVQDKRDYLLKNPPMRRASA